MPRLRWAQAVTENVVAMAAATPAGSGFLPHPASLSHQVQHGTPSGSDWQEVGGAVRKIFSSSVSHYREKALDKAGVRVAAGATHAPERRFSVRCSIQPEDWIP